MQKPKDHSNKKRKQLTSQDLKRRLYQKGIHGNSMPSLKNPLIGDKANILYVNLNSSLNKRQQNQSPKILKKTASAFGKLNQTNKNFFPSITAAEFGSRKKSPFNKMDQSNCPISKTAINFYSHKRTESEPQQQVAFNSSFYKNDSVLRVNETKMTKRLVQKMSGHASKQQKYQKSKFFDEINSPRQQKDEIIQNEQFQSAKQQFDPLSNVRTPFQSSLEQYISLITKNIPNVDQFLYLVRHTSPTITPQSDNIYQLQIIDYQLIKSKDKQPNFQYYTISKKGFCHYYGGKPIQFIDLNQWLQEKQIYQKIKKLNFFSRFRRWKTIKMWIKKVVRHRIQKCSIALQDKLFILNPTVRSCVLDINFINLEMEKSLAIISRNQGSYTLQSFKHCQQKTRRQAASIVQEFSRRSRQSVKKCFQDSLQNLKQILKTKNNNQDKNFAATSHNPKDNAFQVLGFPAKMSYEHRSKLRKLTGRFVRFSYLVDFIHLNGLASIFKTQIQSFSFKLNTLQIQSQVQVHCNHQANKQVDEVQRQKMFNIQLVFRPNQIAQYHINQIPLEIFDISMKIQKASQIFNPLYHVKQKSNQIVLSNKNLIVKQQLIKPQFRKYIPTICDLWLTLKPTLDNIFDQLSFLIKQSMASLKYFERWSKHRQMQKYINILEQWDDIVSQNWQICQNDNLDPISIIQNLQSSMSKIKQMIQISQTKLTQKIVLYTTQPLNIYWENTLADVDQLITNDQIENSAQTIEFYLAYMTQQIEKFQLKIPNSIDLGIFCISLDKMKHQTIDFMKGLCENFKEKLPAYVEDHTNLLNLWLTQKSTRLKEQIHNIDDFVRLNKSLKQIQTQFTEKKDLCNDLGHIYQTMYNYKIESKKRKQFQVQTLKSKDQLEQLLINVQQNIQRKTQFFTRQVSRYHIPNLLKQIQKISDNIGSEQFESLKSSSGEVIRKLNDIKAQYTNLKLRKSKCLQYLSVLKLSEVDISELDELQKQINARLQMWQNLQLFDEFIQKINVQIVEQMDLQSVKVFVNQKKLIVKQIQLVHNKSNNEVLQLLKQKVQKYSINIPLLQGFNDKLTQSHWDQINQILKQYPSLDLRKKQFTLKKFLDTQIGKQAKKIQFIFSKAKVQNQLQLLYSQVQYCWMNTLVKSKLQSKFIIISNPQTMRQSFDYMLKTLYTILSNPFSSTLKQYSITYDSLTQYYNSFENWISIQQKLLKIDSQCKLLDVKKIPDYSQFENCQKIYKYIMKLFSNRNVDNGIKMSKLFINGLDQKLQQMDDGLKKVQDNIKTIIQQHRKNYPPFYLFSDQKLFKIITQLTNPLIIQSTAKVLIPCLQKLQFQGQRISGIYNFDQQKLPRSMISTTLDIQQILLQLADTVIDVGRKNMRSCRYKTVETNLVKLLPLYQSQYLLAINKVDFTNYTQISIDNQTQACQSLKQFYKVMKKDITQDLKLRPTIKNQFLTRYDTLILQTLYNQELLNSLIKQNVMKTTDFQWQSQLRFYWDQSNNDDNNIIVKHCHTKLKYGNQYIGSRAKVVLNSDVNLLFSLSSAQTSVFLGSQYSIQRVLHFIGQRASTLDCSSFTSLKSVINFLVGNWYSETICFYKNFDYLTDNIKKELLQGTQIKAMKQSLMKKNVVFNIKQNQKKQIAAFLGLSHENIAHDFRGQCRVVVHTPINLQHVKNMLKIKGVFESDISEFLFKIFQMVNYLQERSQTYNITLEQFLQNTIQITQNITKSQIFQQFIEYIKPKMGFDNLSILEETVRLYLSSQISLMEVKDQIIENMNSNTSKLTQKHSKQRSNSKRSIRSRDSKMLVPKSQQKSKLNKSKILKQNSQYIDEDQQKYRSVKQALSQRNILILTGAGQSKFHCLKKIYHQSHKIVQIFSFLQNQNSKGLIEYHINTVSEQYILFYFDGIDSKLLQQLNQIWNNQQQAQLKKKMIQKNIIVVIGVEKLSHFDYSALSSFYVINVQLQNDYLSQIAKEWSSKQLESDKQKQVFMKFFTQTLISTFDNWSIKDTKTKQKYVYIFLTHLKSLLPANKLLQAIVYCFIRIFSNFDTQYIKLQFLVKKIIGQDKINQDQKIYDLIYCSINNQHGLHNVKKLFDLYQQSNNSKQTSLLYLDHIITPSIYHNATIMHRILSSTSSGIYLNGPVSSGKSTLYQIYKHLNYTNKSFLKITMCDNSNKQKFISRLLNNFDVFSLKQMKAKVNFQKSVIMIDDINIDNHQLNGNLINHKLQFIKQLIQFKTIQYPKYYPSSSCVYRNRRFNLSQINFILAGHQHIDSLKQCTIPIQLNLHQNQLKSIFNLYLRQRLPYLEVSDLMINDITSTTIDICRKIASKNSQFEGLELVEAKNILSKFLLLKTRDSTAIAKEVQKYWAYLLHEQLSIYDSKNSAIQVISQQDSIIFRQLKNMNLHEHKPQTLCYSFLHNRDFTSNQSSGKKLEYVKDIKKIFNNINERIQKYNQAENKRYGSSFDYIHFDELIKKIIKLANNLPSKDYLLCGRKGTGKQTLVKLVAYLQGSNYKPIVQSSLKTSVMDIFANTNITTMSSYLLIKTLVSLQDIEELKQFYYTDFENQILGSKQLDKPIKIYLKQKDKQQKLLSTSAGNKTVQKTFASLNFTPDFYIAPRPKITQQDSYRYRDAIRIVLLTTNRQIINQIPLNIRAHLMLDEMDEILVTSVQQYNVKFLQAEQVKYSPKTSHLLAQLWGYQKNQLELSLKSYDDAIRLFSSFMATLFQEIKDQLTKYGKIIELFNQLRKLNQNIELQVGDLQQRIKCVNQLLIIQETQTRKQQKIQIQTQLHKKSNCLSKGQKIIQMLSMLIPFFKSKHSSIQRYVLDSQYFQQSLAVAACYFTFLSQLPLQSRRRILNSWYKNDKIPTLFNSQPTQSFLTLFNLYAEQFNAQPIDDLQDFYQNMAIIFNSVKPVIIKDNSKRGKQWLQTVCSFVVVSERQNNFIDIICENLVKPSNILIQITNQQTMNNIGNSFINTLLFLGQSTQTITIKGQQLKVSPQAKFYVLLSECITIPSQLRHEFTIVSFSESQILLEKSLEYSYMSNCHPQTFYTQLQINKKLRNLKLQRQALMLQIAENIYSPFDNVKDEKVEEQEKQPPVSKDKTKSDDFMKIIQKTREELETFVVDITDKVMTRGQSLANKLKQKQQIFKQLQSKYLTTSKFTKQNNEFLQESKNLLSVLSFMSSQSKIVHPQYFYQTISHQQFVKKITLGLRRGFILPQNRISLYLFAIKIWGDQYVQNDFYSFVLVIYQMIEKMQQQIGTKINIFNSNSQFRAIQLNIDQHSLLKNCHSFQQFKYLMQTTLSQLLNQFSYDQLIPYLQFAGTISNLQQGQDRRIVLNNVWISGKETKFYQKLEESLKIVNVDIKDQSTLQNDIKKFIFEQNILMITSIDLLQQTLEHLQKLGSHEKTLYFKCPMTAQMLNKIHFLVKRYNVTEFNNIYQNKNCLLPQCLQKVEKQRELKKLSSVTNIKSMKSIAMINLESDKKISQQKKLSDSKAQNKQQLTKPKTTFEQTQLKLNKTMNKTQKAIFVQSAQSQQISGRMPQAIQLFYQFANYIYQTYNLQSSYSNLIQTTTLSDYISNCCLSEEQQFQFVDKIKLLSKTLELSKKQPYQLINSQITKKINQIRSLLDSIVKQYSDDPCQQLNFFINKLQELITTQQDICQNSLLEASKKAKKVKFQNQYILYFRQFFSANQKIHHEQHDPFDIQNILRKSKKIYDSMKNINQPISVKRNSRKSINVIFKKQDLKEKMSTTSPLTSLSSSTSKKPGLKRISKQTVPTLNRKQSQPIVPQQSFLAPLMLEIQYKKLCSKITNLTQKIQTAIRNAPESSSIELLLLLLEDKIPGTWLFLLQHSSFINSLSSLFKKYIRLQQDVSFCLEKIKRSKHAEIDFAFLKYPKDYVQLHFRRKISYNDTTIYILANNPTSQELESSDDHLKIASVQGSGWKFSNEPNVIDLLSGTQKPTVSEGKILTTCYFMRKDSAQIINMTGIDVYESRTSVKPIMRVYANCKKQAIFNCTANNLSLYLKQQNMM